MAAETAKLNEMENQVTKGAKPAEKMPATPNYVPDAGGTGVEDLGGPTPQNAKPTDDSNKLKTPSAKFAQQGDVQTKGTAGTIKQDGPTKIHISGIDREKVGLLASKIRDVRPPEPYKGKGILYDGEKILRKAGKTGK